MFKCRGVQLALRYDPQSNMTYGLLVSRYFGEQKPWLWTKLYSAEEFLSQPHSIAVAIAEALMESSAERLQHSQIYLQKHRKEMGQNKFEEQPGGNPLEVDFVAATRSLSWVDNKVAVQAVRLAGLLSVLEQITLWNNGLKTLRAEANEGGNQRPQCRGGDIREEVLLGEKISYLVETCRSLSRETEYMDNRVKSLMHSVSKPRLQ